MLQVYNNENFQIQPQKKGFDPKIACKLVAVFALTIKKVAPKLFRIVKLIATSSLKCRFQYSTPKNEGFDPKILAETFFLKIIKAVHPKKMNKM